MAGELVLLDAEGRVLRGLNATGARVWELLDGATPLAAIASAIAAEFDADPARAQADVAAFLRLLEHKALAVAVVDGEPR